MIGCVGRCVYCSSFLVPHVKEIRDDRFGVAGTFDFGKCPTCGALVADPMPDDEEIASYYQIDEYGTHEAAPTSSWAAAVWPLPRRRRTRDLMAIYFELAPRGSAVELGCGAGEKSVALFKRGWNVVAQDIDPKAGRMIGDRPIKLVIGPINDCGLPENGFDLVAMSHMLEHVPRPDEVLLQAWRLVKPGGTVVVIGPNALGFGHRFWGRRWNVLHPHHVAVPGPESMTALARRVGLPTGQSVTVATNADYFGQASIDKALANRPLPRLVAKMTHLGVGILAQAIATPLIRVRPSSGNEIVWSAQRP